MTVAVNKANSLEEGVENIIEAMKRDYAQAGFDLEENYEVKEGRKYIKIIRNRSVSAFISKVDFKHFKKGDVLKAASWNTPALNSARGNVFEQGYPMQWTGPVYL